EVTAGRAEAEAIARAVHADDPAVARTTLADAAWLSARAALGREVTGWPALELVFDQHAAHAAQIARLDHALAAHGVARTAHLVQRDALAGEHREASRRHLEAQRKAEAFHK